MNCHRIQSLISAYVDGELPGVEMLAIRQHLSGCNDCKVEFESILLVKRSMSCLSSMQPSKDLADRILAQIDRSGLAPESSVFNSLRRHFSDLSSGFSSGLKLVAVGACLFLAVVFVSQNGSSTQSMTYNPPFAKALVRSLDQPEQMRAFYVPNSANTGTLYLVPETQAIPHELVFDKTHSVPVKMMGSQPLH
jgi:hypothetical protein